MKILALSPHTDDCELSCWGTLHKYKQQGAEVMIMAFSECGSDITEKEFYSSCLNANFEPHQYYWKVRQFSVDQVKIRNELYHMSAIKPDLVFCPSSSDLHADHEVIHNEAKRIFKHTSLLGYETPWNDLRPIHRTAFSKISRDNLEAKKSAIACYKSQAHRTYCQPEYIESLARVRGQQANCEFAESFEVIRWFL